MVAFIGLEMNKSHIKQTKQGLYTLGLFLLLLPFFLSAQEIVFGYDRNLNDSWIFDNGHSYTLRLPLKRSEQKAYFEMILSHRRFVKRVAHSTESPKVYNFSKNLYNLTGSELVILYSLTHPFSEIVDIQLGGGGGLFLRGLYETSIYEEVINGVSVKFAMENSSSSFNPGAYGCLNLRFFTSERSIVNIRWEYRKMGRNSKDEDYYKNMLAQSKQNPGKAPPTRKNYFRFFTFSANLNFVVPVR